MSHLTQVVFSVHRSRQWSRHRLGVVPDLSRPPDPTVGVGTDERQGRPTNGHFRGRHKIPQPSSPPGVVEDRRTLRRCPVPGDTSCPRLLGAHKSDLHPGVGLEPPVPVSEGSGIHCRSPSGKCQSVDTEGQGTDEGPTNPTTFLRSCTPVPLSRRAHSPDPPPGSTLVVPLEPRRLNSLSKDNVKYDKRKEISAETGRVQHFYNRLKEAVRANGVSIRTLRGTQLKHWPHTIPSTNCMKVST